MKKVKKKVVDVTNTIISYEKGKKEGCSCY